jgi:uncharacterized protein with HEPN domain
MSSRDWKLRVLDILNAIAEIQEQTEACSYEEFRQNSLLQKAVLYNFIIIGEAANSIPNSIQALAPDLPWRDMSDMRNVIAHEYFQINLRLVWKTIQLNLPPLVEFLQRLLDES